MENIKDIEDYSTYKNYVLKMKEDYLNYTKSCKSLGTYKCYYYHLKSIIDWFFEKEYYFVKDNLLLYIQYCHEKNLSNKTINHRIIYIKAMLKYFSYVSDIYVIKKLKVIEKPFNALNEDEIKIFKDYVNSNRISYKNKLVLSLLYDTGVRLHELVNIEIKNIDLNKKMILLMETKSKKARYVFYTEFTEKYMLEVYDKNNKYLLDYTEHGVYKFFLRAKEHLPFLKFHPHMLRHTLATSLLKKGADLESIRQILGHSSIKQTQQYLHFDVDYIKSVYDNVMCL